MSIKKTKTGYRTLSQKSKVKDTEQNEQDSKGKGEMPELSAKNSKKALAQAPQGEGEGEGNGGGQAQAQEQEASSPLDKAMKDLKYIKVVDVYVKEDNFKVLEANVSRNGNSLLIGETGTGKTSLVSALAKLHKKELIRVSVNGTTGVEEIIGKYLAKNGTTIWQDGLLIQAMREGKWIIFDEINSALPEILFSLHQLLDHERKVTITEKDGEVVYPHADFRFFANMNPPEEYAGTKDLNKALLSRFDAVIYVDVVPPVLEVQTIVDRTQIATEDANNLVILGQLLRQRKAEDRIFYFCSTRDLIQCAYLMKCGVVQHTAIVNTILNKMNKEDQKDVEDVIKQVKDNKTAFPTFEEVEQLKYTVKTLESSCKALEQANKNTEQDRVRAMEQLAQVTSDYNAKVTENDTLKRKMSEKIIEKLMKIEV